MKFVVIYFLAYIRFEQRAVDFTSLWEIKGIVTICLKFMKNPSSSKYMYDEKFEQKHIYFYALNERKTLIYRCLNKECAQDKRYMMYIV